MSGRCGGDSEMGGPAAELVERLAAVVERLEAVADGQSGPAPRFLTIAQAAGYVSLSPDSIRRLIERGDLVAFRPVRGRVLVDRRELDGLVLGSTRRPRGSRGQWRRRRGAGPVAADQQTDGKNTEGRE